MVLLHPCLWGSTMWAPALLPASGAWESFNSCPRPPMTPRIPRLGMFYAPHLVIVFEILLGAAGGGDRQVMAVVTGAMKRQQLLCLQI